MSELRGLPAAIRPYDASMTDVGGLRGVQVLDAITTRVRAANPSPMTLSGTNTYLLGRPGGGEMLVVDPGPDLPEHRAAIDAAAAAADARITTVVVTHHHADHAAAVGWADDWGAPAYAFDPARTRGTRPLGDGDAVPIGGVEVVARHQPGHSSDHLCLEITGSGVVLTGDHVLGEGTTVIAWPDGDLRQYLTSLEALGAMRPTALYPGHGEVITEPVEHIAALLAHRAERTSQILAAIDGGHETVDAIVAQVYPDLQVGLRPAAARSVTAHLVDLERQGRVTHAQEHWRGP